MLDRVIGIEVERRVRRHAHIETYIAGHVDSRIVPGIVTVLYRRLVK